MDCWWQGPSKDRLRPPARWGRFETELLATDANIEVLAGMNGAWIDKVHDRRPPKMIILDMDSSVSPTHGEQEGTAYNGHFGCTCYHPLFLFNQFGDLGAVFPSPRQCPQCRRLA